MFCFLFEVLFLDEWVVFDCEIIGLNVCIDEIIFIGVVCIVGNCILIS